MVGTDEFFWYPTSDDAVWDPRTEVKRTMDDVRSDLAWNQRYLEDWLNRQHFSNDTWTLDTSNPSNSLLSPTTYPNELLAQISSGANIDIYSVSASIGEITINAGRDVDLSANGDVNIDAIGTVASGRSGDVNITADGRDVNIAASRDIRMDNSIIDQIVLRAPASAPTTARMNNASLSFYLDEAGNNLKVQVKYSGGTLKTGTLAVV